MPSNPWFALLFLATTSLALWGMLTRNPAIPPWVHRHDKAMHFLAFALLAALAQGAWSSVSLLHIWFALAALGLRTEGLQELLSERRFCWRDAAANALGAATVLGALHWQS